MTDEGRIAGAGRTRPSDSAKARRNRLDELVAALLDGEMTSEVVSGIAQAIAEDECLEDDLLGQIRIHNLLCHWSAERDRSDQSPVISGLHTFRCGHKGA